MSLRFLNLPLLVIVAIFSGCADNNSNSYFCSGDARAISPTPARKVYISKAVLENEDPLEFAEYRAIIGRALCRKGFEVVEDKAAAENLIFFGYAISSPKTVGYESTGHSTPLYNAYNGKYMGSTHSGGTYAVTEHMRMLSVGASTLDAKTPLWSVRVRSSGSSDNLRQAFPCLALVASDFFGRTNTATEEVQVDANHPEVRKLLSDVPAFAASAN